MSDEDRAIQDRARRFVDDELIPWEEHAEAHGGHIPDDARARHHELAVELGLYAMNMPRDLGGTGMTMLPAGAGVRADRPRHQRAGLVRPHAAGVDARGGNDVSDETWIVPTIRGEMHECYAITEDDAGSDVDAIAGDRAARRR